MWIFVAVTAVSIVIPVGIGVMTAWGGTTLAYELTPTSIQIHYGPKTIAIDRSEITHVRTIERPGKGRRHFGTNMPGLKQGQWSFEETGRITLYATDTTQLTIIETDAEKWGINPADPERFQQLIRTGESDLFQPDPKSNARTLIATMVLIISFGFVPLVVITVFVRRTHRHLKYELENDAVIIYGGRRPTVISYRDITHVRVANPKGTPFRLFGIGMPGLHWGAYSWKDAGPGLKMYATRLRPIVLISAHGKTYGVTPEQSEQFVHEVKSRLPS